MVYQFFLKKISCINIFTLDCLHSKVKFNRSYEL